MLRPDGQIGFNTQTGGRIEPRSTFYCNAGLSEVPYFEEPTPGPVSTPDFFDTPGLLSRSCQDGDFAHAASVLSELSPSSRFVNACCFDSMAARLSSRFACV